MERTLRILHLEDDARDAELVAAALRAGGLDADILRLDTRAAFEEALCREEFDVVLSDFSLPSFDGATALSLVHSHRPGTPFLLVSGVLGEDAAVESLLAGASDYILKHRLGRLVPAVRRALSEADDRRARSRAEEAVRASEARYRRLFESSKDGLLVFDAATGRILDANPAFLSLVAFAREEVVGRTVPELDIAGDSACAAAFEDIRTRDEARHEDLELRSRDGEAVSVDLVSTAYALDGQRVIQCSTRDIRERKRLESQLRLSQKLEAVGQLAGGVAHDFNNILAVINSYTELVVDQLGSEDPRRDDLEQVLAAGARAAALTRQLLAFSRRQFLKPTVLSPNAVVVGLERMLRRIIGEDVRLELRLDPGLGHVRADPAQLEQVLMNLVVNARDAMPRGGQLVIATGSARLAEGDLGGHPDARPGAYVVLEVKDTGQGIDPAVLPHIFEPFFTTKGPGKGTGLGLSTVYGIVKESGGFVEVRSQLGQGTAFRVHLPLGQALPAAAEAATEAEPSGGSETVLVVEDDGGVRRLVHRVLEPAGYTVLSAPSGPDAFRLQERRAGPVHLLLTDVVLPAMDGAAVAERFRVLQPGIRVLFMSGYPGRAPSSPDVSGRDLWLLRKPFTAADLLRKVRDRLDAPEGPA
ncbi:MAG TPA: response regulator [Anaeromyxobacter sp.]|nr:response regulator [Anaeromyxobacter sp.]